MSIERSESNKITIVALVENKPSVLNRVASMFRRRNFNVDSLTVGRTHRAQLSRMTIVVDIKKLNPHLVKANLLKLVNVIDVRILEDVPHISRDLVLVKVRTNDTESYNGVTEICERYPARIVDIGREVAIVELVGTAPIVEAMIEELRPIGIIEMIRTGIVAMARGTRIIDTEYEPILTSTSEEESTETTADQFV